MREPTGPHGKADNLMLKYIAAAARICIKISLTLATRPNKQVKQMGEILVKKLLHTNCNTKRCIHSKCNTFFLETKYYPSVWPKYIQATNTNFSKSVNFKQASSPSQTQTIFNSKNLKRKKPIKLRTFIDKSVSCSVPFLVVYVEAQPVHFHWDLEKRNLSSLWESLTYAAVLSLSAPGGIKKTNSP